MIDKKALYGRFQDGQDRRQKFALKAAHKALDIAEDDVQITTTQSGFGWKELAVIGAIGLGVAWMFNQKEPAPVVPPAQTSPADADYEIRFYDEAGNPIRVDRVPGAESGGE